MKKKLIIAWSLIAVFTAAMIFDVVSEKNAIPAEGMWKGNIHQFHPAYPQQGLVIILVGIVGATCLLIGLIMLTLSIREHE